MNPPIRQAAAGFWARHSFGEHYLLGRRLIRGRRQESPQSVVEEGGGRQQLHPRLPVRIMGLRPDEFCHIRMELHDRHESAPAPGTVSGGR